MTWTLTEALKLFHLPFNDLLFQAHQVHRENFNPNVVQISQLLSIKTGSCPEDCAYCPQSAHHNTTLKKEPLMDLDDVLEKARQAKENGATRFCMGAAWRNPREDDLDLVIEMVKGVKELGLESCVTLGLLQKQQAEKLKEAGLDYYNHNIDTAEEFYPAIITTRCFQDRLDTLDHVRESGIKVCCGGILGMGETIEHRASMLVTLANLPTPPESVPINMLMRADGTPLENVPDIDVFDFVRTIAVARILLPKARVRLSAGRTQMTDEAQALCYFAGANSIFYGDVLLTLGNPAISKDATLFEKLGLEREQ